MNTTAKGNAAQIQLRLLQYYNIWEFLDERDIKPLQHKTHSVNDCYDFYHKTIKDDIKEGDQISLESFLISML